MKKIAFILIAILSIGLSSCGNSTGKKQNTHTHDDGSTHEEHTTETVAPTSQESFKVEADSTTAKEVAKPEKKAHDHSDETGHKH